MLKLLRYAYVLIFLACMPILANAQCTVNAGGNFNHCMYSNDPLLLQSSVAGNFTTYSWTTTGTGTFSSSTILTPRYTFSPADVASGSVTLTLTASGGTCGSVTAQSAILIYSRPSVVLQDEFTVCGSQIALTSTTAGVATYEWINMFNTGGVFSTTTAPNTTYTASAADLATGFIMFRLRAISSPGGCTNEDTVRVNFATAPSVSAGVNAVVCSVPNGSTVLVNNATTTGSFTSYTWTTSGTGTFANPTTLNSIYTFSAADIAAGSVVLTITGNSATCGSSASTRTVTVSATPVVSAGADKTICTPTVLLSGTVTPESGTIIQWESVYSSGGTFNGATTLTPVYILSDADTSRGYALLRLRATSLAGCTNEDTIRVNKLTRPFVYAGEDIIACSGNVRLSASALYAATKIWTTAGSGTFLYPHDDTATYVPSAADRTSGMVTLTYTGTNACSTVSSTVQVNFTTTATAQVNAGADASVCGTDTIRLAGTISNATGGTWTANGSGRFLYPASSLVNAYEFSGADKTAGSVTFTLTSYNNGGCTAGSDQLIATIKAGSATTVYAGPDQVSSAMIQLNASVTNATGQIWETSGSGLFTPNPTSLNAFYIPSALDITAGSVELTLKATGTCGIVSDALTLFTSVPSSISGTVNAGTNTLDRGIVYLYVFDAVEGEKIAGIDTIYQTDNGVYEFDAVSNGTYTIYAVPLNPTVYAASYLATYYGNASPTEWASAEQTLVQNGSVNVFDIQLAAYTSALPNWNTGNDVIAGTVFLNIPAANARLAGPNDVPLSGAVVYLTNVSGDVITYTVTDKNGMYRFDHVRTGNYLISTEYVSTETEDKPVTVDGNPQTVEDGNAFASRVSSTTGVVSSVKYVSVTAYPNPATDNVSIRLTKTGNCSIKISDETGKLHAEQQTTIQADNIANVSLEGMQKGLYIIQVVFSEEVYTTKVVKF
jgi:hypothetical protein